MREEREWGGETNYLKQSNAKQSKAGKLAGNKLSKNTVRKKAKKKQSVSQACLIDTIVCCNHFFMTSVE